MEAVISRPVQSNPMALTSTARQALESSLSLMSPLETRLVHGIKTGRWTAQEFGTLRGQGLGFGEALLLLEITH